MKIARVLIVCAVVAVGACHRESDTAPQTQTAPRVAAPPPVRKGPSVAELTAGMVEAAVQGKSQVPVLLKFELAQKPIVGQTLDINLAVVSQIDADSAQIQVTGGDGLSVPAGANQLDLPALGAGQVYRQTIKVSPTAEGVLLLNVTLSLKHDEINESQAFSIPLIAAR
ncbi:MAG: hypothetical protein WA803_14050 [Steroidobacteraceae bacterium]